MILPKSNLRAHQFGDKSHYPYKNGAARGTRTLTPIMARDFKSRVSTNSTITA